MRAVCHIGHHKTGTTSLQAFLSQNSHRLLQAGILYPWVESQGAAVALGKAVRGGDFAAMLPFNVREAQNAPLGKVASTQEVHQGRAGCKCLWRQGKLARSTTTRVGLNVVYAAAVLRSDCGEVPQR